MTDTATIEQPETQAPEETSIADHAAQFSPAAQQAAAEAAPDPLKPIRPVDQQRRDQGKFAEGRQRMKAKDAVDRINTLTGRAKTAEERVAALESEVERLKASGAPAAQVAKAEAKVEAAQPSAPSLPDGVKYPEAAPSDKDPKFNGDYGLYLDARAEWAGRKAYWEERQIERITAARTAYIETFTQRIEAAKAKYPDYENALRWDVPWLDRSGAPTAAGKILDAFVKEDDAGAEILYHLHTHPDETASLLQMNALAQAKTLSLLSQRLLASPHGAAGVTGSAPERKVVLAPRPPNPVRTEAQRVSDSPPPTDGSLSIAEHRKAFGPAARR